jgi:hypothetical protein
LVVIEDRVQTLPALEQRQRLWRQARTAQRQGGDAPLAQCEPVRRPLHQAHAAQVAAGLLPAEQRLPPRQPEVLLISRVRTQDTADEPDGLPLAHLREDDAPGQVLAAIGPQQSGSSSGADRQTPPGEVPDQLVAGRIADSLALEQFASKPAPDHVRERLLIGQETVRVELDCGIQHRVVVGTELPPDPTIASWRSSRPGASYCGAGELGAELGGGLTERHLLQLLHEGDHVAAHAASEAHPPA